MSAPPAFDSDASFREAEAVVRRIVAAQHDRPSLASDIACHLGAQIVEGLRAPGEDLNTVELARRHKTSRTPVREALMLLEKQGLVEIPPRRRPRVMVFDPPHIRDIYRVRSALLELAAVEVVRHASEAQLDRLDAAIARMQSHIEDLRPYIWATVDFQDITTDIAGNRFAKQVIDSLLLKTLPLRRLSLSQPGRLRRSFDDHARLMTAYRERDDGLAAALVRANHRAALEQIERLIA